jgi:hypothetical protein
MHNHRVWACGCRAALVVGLACLVAVTGCGKGAGEGYPVSGKITYKGAPLAAGGSVRFVPISVEGGKEAGGVIEKDGSYKLNTNVVPGEYRVEVFQNTVLEPTKYGDKEGEVLSKEVPLPADKTIPHVYQSATSPLKVTVDEKENDILLTLRPQGGKQAPVYQGGGP